MVTLSAKSSLILGENKAGFPRVHLEIQYDKNEVRKKQSVTKEGTVYLTLQSDNQFTSMISENKL